MSGVRQSTLHNLVCGASTNPKIRTLHKTATAFNMTLSEFFDYPELNNYSFDDECEEKTLPSHAVGVGGYYMYHTWDWQVSRAIYIPERTLTATPSASRRRRGGWASSFWFSCKSPPDSGTARRP